MLYYLSRLSDDFVAALVFMGAIATALLIGICFHEFSHAFVADSLGDRTPRSFGRVTLNPLAHLDPMGTILMVIVGFGWGKPVPVNPNATRNPKQTLWMTALAGPFSNFVVAAVAGLAIRLDVVPWVSPFDLLNFDLLSATGWSNTEYLGLYLSSITLFSVILGVFNLIPIAPLDGFKVVAGLLPYEMSRSFLQLEPYGPIILLILLLSTFLTGGQFAILFEVMDPFIRFFLQLFAGVGNDPFVGGR
ncbi:MAG: site-2 protease family protein [Chloroflexi bacterium]|nr:MAG: site-2 protease family protein [Chloroflexota bacterium]